MENNRFQSAFTRLADQRVRQLSTVSRLAPTQGQPFAEARALSQQLGLPQAMVERDPDRARTLLDSRTREVQLREAPATADWFRVSTDNLRMAADDIRGLGLVEGALRGVSDYGRSAAAGLVEGTFGRPLQGFGILLSNVDEATYEARRATAEAQARALDARGLTIQAQQVRDAVNRRNARDAMQFEATDAVGEVLRMAGEGWRGLTDQAIQIPDARQGFGTQVSGALGQIAGQILLTALTGSGGAAVAMTGQGISLQAEQLADAGVDLASPEAIAALSAGGAITAATEKVGLDRLLRIVPDGVRSTALRRLVRTFQSGGEEALQETVEAMAQNVVTMTAADSGYSLDGLLGEGMAREAAVAGTAGAIVRGVVEMMIPGRQRGAVEGAGQALQQAQAQASAIQGVAQAARQSALAARDPAMAQSHAAEVVRAAGGNDTIFLDGGALRTFFQSAGIDDPFLWATEYDLDPQEVADAIETDGLVAIPMETFAGRMAQDEALTDFVSEAGRFDPEGVSLNDAQRAMDEIDAIRAELAEQFEADDARRREAYSSERMIFQDIIDQLSAAGVSVEEAQQTATLNARIASTLAARSGLDPVEFWQRFRPTIMGPNQPEVVRRAVDEIDLMMARVRAGEGARTDLLGPTLVEAIRQGGGIIDDGGELASMDPDIGRRRGQRALIRQPSDVASGPDLTGAVGVNPDRQYGFEAVFEGLVDAGYFPELQGQDIRTLDARQALIDAIDAEMRGEPRYIDNPEAREAFDRGAEVDEFREYLGRLGLDDTATNEEVRAAIKADLERSAAQVMGEPIGDDARMYAQRRGAGQDPRGSFSLPAGGLNDGPSVIRLFESRNLSTFLHESGHFWLEVMRAMAADPNASQDVQDMWRATIDWMGVTDPAQIGTEQHELWARTFEAYLMEGEAPAADLVPVFERFRAWLVHVYTTITRLKANLTPEIRNVLDRMVASDEQIAEAQQRAGARSMFGGAAAVAEGLMTEAEAQAYGRMVERNHAEAQATMLNRMQRFIRAQQSEEYRQRAEVVRAEVEREINGNRTFQALEWLSNGVWVGRGDAAPAEPFKLSAEAIERDFPGYQHTLPGPKRLGKRERASAVSTRLLWTRQGGAHPDDAALLFGFRRGEELLQALSELTQTRKQAIEAETTRRMREEMGDPATDGTASREALEAIHNDRLAHQIEMELKALNKALPPGSELERAAAGKRRQVSNRSVAREVARRMIGRMKTRQASKPGRFLAAERKAARLAEQAFQRKDYAEAARQKQEQLLNNALFREATKVEAEVDRGLQMVKTVRKKEVRQRLGQDYVDQIEAILDGYQFRPRSMRRMRSMRGLLDFVQRMRDEGREDEVAIPQDVLEEAARDRDHPHYSEITVEQFRGAMDAIANIRHLGEMKNKLRLAAEKRDLDAVAGEVADQIEDGAPRRDTPFASRTNAEGMRAMLQNAAAGVMNIDTVLRELDGWADLGPTWRHIKRPIREAYVRLVDRQQQAAVDLEAMFAAYEKGDQRRMSRKTLRVQFGGQPRSMSKWDVIAVALNWGNDYNREAVLDGYKATEAEVWALFGQHMTDADWAFVQGVWDYMDGFWPEIAALQKRTNGLEPERVERSEVTSPAGKALAKGGYYPVVFDPGASIRAMEDRAADEALGMLPGRRASAQTRRGHTVERQGTGGRPVLLDVGVIQQHVQGVLYDLEMREAVTYADKVLKHPQVRGAFSSTGNLEAYRTADLWLKDIAAGEKGPGEAMGKWLRRLRLGFTVSRLGWNLSTALIQPTGYLQSAVVIGKGYAALGVQDVLQPAKWQWALSQSAALRQRTQTYQRDVFDTLRAIRSSKMGEAQQSLLRSGFWLMGRVQLAVDVATWMGAYRRGMDDHQDAEKARIYADSMVGRAQGSGLFVDRTGWERGTLDGRTQQSEFIKMWTMLASYMMAKMNVAYERTASTDFRKPGEVLSWAADMVLLFTLEGILMRLARGWWPDDEDDRPWWVETMGLAAGETVSAATGGVPIIREFYGQISGFSGGGPVGAVGGDVARAVTQVSQGEFDAAAVKAVLSTTGVFLMVPGTSQLNRVIDAAWAQAEGEEVSPMEYVTGLRRD